MSARPAELYRKAKKNAEFMAAILSADGDKPPGAFSSQTLKGLFGLTYYGWLVGRYGDDWERNA